MSVAPNFSNGIAHETRGHSDLVGLGRVASAMRTILGGMIASKEYRHLTAMSDRQLSELGLSRDGIAAEVHRRHLAPLGRRS